MIGRRRALRHLRAQRDPQKGLTPVDGGAMRDLVARKRRDHDDHVRAVTLDRLLGRLSPRERSLPVRITVSMYDGLLEAGVEVARPIALVSVAAQRLAERQSISHRHQVIQDGIYGRREIVKTAGDIIQPFVDFSVVGRRSIRVKVEQSLGVERGPAQEEGDDDRGCNNKIFGVIFAITAP